MRLATIKYQNLEQAAIDLDMTMWPLVELNRIFSTSWPETVWEILQQQKLDELNKWFRGLGSDDVRRINQITLQAEATHFAPLYRNPGKIWGIGLNYQAHAADLSAALPLEMPASFIKANTTLIGPGDEICLPQLSHKVTGEAELGLIIGKQLKQDQKVLGLDALAGFCSIIDMTAEDILLKDPRYLTLSKNFDTFFSLGPQLITLDEFPNLAELVIKTIKNGKIIAKNRVHNMTFPPAELLAFHSKVMSMQPGDIISSGTPGAVHLENGDMVECRIDGFRSLKNPVTDLKRKE